MKYFHISRLCENGLISEFYYKRLSANFLNYKNDMISEIYKRFSLSIPTENIRDPLVFECLQGVQKYIIAHKSLERYHFHKLY